MAGLRPNRSTVISGFLCEYEQYQTFNETCDLSLCAHDTIAVFVPIGYAVVICLPYFLYLHRYVKTTPGISYKSGSATLMKLLFAFLFAMTYLTETLYTLDLVFVSHSQIYHALVRLFGMCLTSMFVLLVTYIERKRRVEVSKCLFVFWCFTLLMVALRFSSGLTQKWFLDRPNLVFFVFTCVRLVVAIVQVIVYGFVGVNVEADGPKEDILLAEFQAKEGEADNHPISPELRASVASQLTYWWMTWLILKGWRKPLQPSSIYALPPDECNRPLYQRLKSAWDCYVKSAPITVKRPTPKDNKPTVVEAISETGDEKTSAAKTTPIETSLRNPPWILVKTIFSAFGLKFLFAGFLKLMQDSLLLMAPVYMMLITGYMKDSKNRPAWHGYIVVGALLINSVLQTTIFNQYFYTVSIVGMRVRSALTSAIYNKCLRMSNAARQKTTTGKTVNLMAVDTSQFLDASMFLHIVWSSPLQITVVVILLWVNLGPSTLVGLICMILTVLFSGVVARFTKKFHVAKMKKQDERIKLVNEMLMGIKAIKLYAWERSFQAKIAKARKEEISLLKKSVMLQCLASIIWLVAPYAVTLLTFAAYIFSDPERDLEPVKAFTSIVLFTLMRFPLVALPGVINMIVHSTVSLKRIANYLSQEELDESAVSHVSFGSDSVVSIKDGDFSWSDSSDGSSASFMLRNINLEVKKGQLIAIVGQVGAGKSSLLSAILGEMVKLNGKVEMAGHCGYVAQTPWIQNATLKNNVLFSFPEDERFYDEVMSACALKPDLEVLASGDATEIGEKGINLSGGQKQRVALARAVYAKSEIYLFDDPLSAVDAYTARHLFDEVVGPSGMLAKNIHGPRTRIWSTHRLNFLPQCDHVALMAEGKIVMQGSFKELVSRCTSFCDLIRSYMQSNDCDNDEALELESALSSEIDLSRAASVSSVSSGVATNLARSHSGKRAHLQNDELEGAVKNAENKKSYRITEAEELKEGYINISIFTNYAKALGVCFLITIIMSYAISYVFSVGAQNYLSLWTDQVVYNATAALSNKSKNFTIFSILYVCHALATTLAVVTMAFSSIRAAVNLHDKLLASITRTAIVFFESTPIGRIVNRFSKDMDLVDTALRHSISSFLICLAHAVATFVIISIKLPVFLSVGVPLLGIFIFIQRIFVAFVRQLKRIESAARSPLLTKFSETITGVSTIRAFHRQNLFSHQFSNAVDEHQMSTYSTQMAYRWLSLRMELIGSVITFTTALFGVIQRDTLDPGTLGLALAYAMTVSQTLTFMVRSSSEVETHVVAVERIDEYMSTPKEGDWTVPSIDMSPQMAHWPRQGEITFENVVLRYREDLEPALRGLSFTVQPKEKVGIVGRTGAGKSSLSVALLRIIEITSGRILIDGIDVRQIGIHTLRRGVTPIPQDPTLFSGTLRFNLDPFGERTDEDILHSLELVNMRLFVDAEPKGLDMEIAENGENLSAGQRQLVCMARALLRRPNDQLDHHGAHILLMDEATAAVDVNTDRLVTEMVHQEFTNSTVLTIAHRLDTVINYDKILVLANGQLVEFDSPEKLLANPQSEFYKMAKAAGLTK